MDVTKFIGCILFSHLYLLIIDQPDGLGIEKLNLVMINFCLGFNTHPVWLLIAVSPQWLEKV